MNTAAMPADTQALEARLEPLSLARLDEVLAIEALAHPHPWSRRHFTDALASGYRIDILLGGDQVLGYFVAMRGVEEAHLLNLTVAPAFQRQASTTSTTAASASSSHRVVGTRPACIMAMVSAPKATNSPWGMKITRVTEKTSTSASAINP